MTRCKLFNFLFLAIPIKTFQAYLIKVHLERCPSCSGELIERDEALALLAREEKVPDRISLWAGIQAGLCEDKRKKALPRLLLRWRWAAGAAFVIFAILAGFLFLNRSNEADMAMGGMSEDQIRINYINVEEKPAGAFVYKLQDSEMIFIWAERTP